MKKLVSTLIALALCAFGAFAQTLQEAGETFNNGGEALNNGEKTEALGYFKLALSQASSLEGEEGSELVLKCQEIIPALMISIAKDDAKAGDYEKALATAKECIKLSKSFGDDASATDAEDLIPQIYLQKGGVMYNSKNYTAAIDAFTKALEINPANGQAALRLGMSYSAVGNLDEAVKALEKAAANGQEKNAYKTLNTMFLKKAAASLKAKDFQAAYDFATKACSYVESAQAYQIAGQAASSLGNNGTAISNFEKYLELSPNAKNATQIAYTLGVLYQQSGNKKSAIEYYEKAVNDPAYGGEAQKMIDLLSK